MDSCRFTLSVLNPYIGCIWTFKKKMKSDGSIDKYKARLVLKGFRQSNGINYFDTYAHVARISSIRTLMSLASIYNLEIHQMDVKTAFLSPRGSSIGWDHAY
jgi:hypothetical protein